MGITAFETCKDCIHIIMEVVLLQPTIQKPPVQLSILHSFSKGLHSKQSGPWRRLHQPLGRRSGSDHIRANLGLKKG